jgi:signal transduction protein with GAF and PtsI domain
MFPMIATMAELRDAKAILNEEATSLEIKPMPCGIMVEIPAVAIMAEVFAEQADFFSIGTNDLTQYTLAMDRGHPKLAPKVDALNPSLLRLIAQTVEGAKKHKKFTGVCGGNRRGRPSGSDPHRPGSRRAERQPSFDTDDQSTGSAPLLQGLPGPRAASPRLPHR